MKNEFKNLMQRIYAKTKLVRGKESFFNDVNNSKIYLMLVPKHGNMGDQAIIYATIAFLKDYFSDYKVVIVNFSQTYKDFKRLKEKIKEDDIIFLPGGGNMGNLYPWEEFARRFIIENFLSNKIVSMPQTIDFRNTKSGRRELKKTMKVYNSHPNLTLIAREEKSYNLMKACFPQAKVLICPDIVFYLSSIFGKQRKKRSMIMSCIRSDKESISNDKVLLNLQKHFPDLLIDDTVVARNISNELREIEVNSKLNQFMRSKVVITDRMHGMVFCAITNTPCVVTKSLDHKILGTYQWIKNLDYICFVDKLDSDSTIKLIDGLSRRDISDKKLDVLQDHFKTLRKRIGL
ncbi:polysaccharide pyruvyl transferase family protein [Ligilactobacillus pobuzihii]|uniref:General stress protein 30 n=1 Tax=Ligilactobacillus pobuzihii TaxID=449659 RepID=A0A0R2LHX6_9LACO|nr:polysaccharide pyruvyl transferase family protein [Ligilactobacillus pobuzihii]KRK09309.1 general stress protein 30 [Ligilactobacillus pobuzihii E100301 = KCTC 13174]KRO01321.1 general stress protein 30 [Ligilactobacillus pobuzihii]GEN49054.1 putative pyruvyl transferase EpsI [Ligilactobacillus pobuzihii]